MFNIRLLAVFLSTITALSGLAADLSNLVHLEHIDSAGKLRDLKFKYPSISEDILEDGYQNIPEEWEFSHGVGEVMQQNPVWGMWFIMYHNDVAGRITLYKPRAMQERSQIFTWIKPEYRYFHIGREARQKLYQHILPFVGKSITVQEVISERSHQVKTYHITNFRGILAEIAIDNYASLISELRSHAQVFDYVGEQGRVSLLKLHFPANDISAEKLQHDKQLSVLKAVVEPAILLRETRDKAILILKSLERGRNVDGFLSQ